MASCGEASVSRSPQSNNLSDDLSRETGRLIRSALEIARIRMFQAHLDDARLVLNAAAALSILDSIGPEDCAKLLLGTSEVTLVRAIFDDRDHDDAIEPLSQAERIATDLDSKHLMADALAMRAWILCYRELSAGRPRDIMIDPARRSLELRRETDDKVGIAESLFLLGLAHEHKAEAEPAKAEALFVEARQTAAGVGEQRWRSYAVRHLGWIALGRGQLEEALGCFEESLRLRREIGFTAFLPPAIQAVGLAQMELGRLEEAEATFKEAYGLATEIGMERFRYIALMPMGEVRERQGDSSAAETVYREALEIAESSLGEASIREARAAVERLQEDT